MNKISLIRVLVILLFTSLQANARDFIIGVENTQNKPFWWTENETYQGVSRDLLDAFAASRGHHFHYRAYPVKRLLHAFMSGEIDFKFPDHPSWRPDIDRNGRVNYSLPLHALEEGSLVKAERAEITVDQIKRLGIVRGWTATGYLDAIAADKVQLVESTHLPALIKMCISGRIDAIYTNKTAYRYEVKKLGYDVGRLVFAPHLPKVQSEYLLSTIKHPGVIDELDRFLKTQSEQSAQQGMPEQAEQK